MRGQPRSGGWRRFWARIWRPLWLTSALLIYLALACYQLGLPGLHYDEAKEAGLNAMQLLTGAAVTPFRDAAWSVGGLRLPLMVQDYIGALNVYLALPPLALSGIGVPNLRLLSVLEGLLALILLERAVSEWSALRAGAPRHAASVTYAGSPSHPLTRSPSHAPLSAAGLFVVTLLAASPSYVFWARQGVFVTNLLLPWTLLCLWQGVRWLRTGEGSALVLAALGAGLALYAKLSAWWVIVPFALPAGGWWLVCRWRSADVLACLPHARRGAGGDACAPLRLRTLALAAGAFLLPLLPLLAFNLQTGGTLLSIFGNLGRSYYGVNNADLPANALVRGGQLVQVLRGDQFWYLGAVYANGAAPVLALIAVLVGLWRSRRVMVGPLLLLGGAFGASLFTVSDLWVTHYVLIQPLLAAVVGLGLWAFLEGFPEAFQKSPLTFARAVPAALFLLTWLLLDLSASFRYHTALAQSGGLGDHSDASYHLAYHLQTNGMGAPVALDWGMDATVRYLTRGAVTPIEIFGYASPAAPDAEFDARLASFLANPDNRYLLHAPEATVFAGRREAFLAAVGASGRQAAREAVFAQRNGVPLYEIWRVTAP